MASLLLATNYMRIFFKGGTSLLLFRLSAVAIPTVEEWAVSTKFKRLYNAGLEFRQKNAVGNLEFVRCKWSH